MADEDLEAPLEFKLFEPCRIGNCQDCAGKTDKYQCLCPCHIKGDPNDEEDEENWN